MHIIVSALDWELIEPIKDIKMMILKITYIDNKPSKSSGGSKLLIQLY